MSETARTRLARAVPKAVLTIVSVLLLGANLAQADTKYLADGALQNAKGGWDLPAQGTCPVDVTKTTRPDCLALRLAAADSTGCTTGYLPAGSTAWTTSGVCNDLVNTTQVACQTAPDRLWNAASSVCSIVMKGDDRNAVVCAKHNGNWVTVGTCIGVWIMPSRTTYNPPVLTADGLTGAGAGDQCLRCHNATTQYNGARVRDTQNTLKMGHKNMSRPVTVGTPWGGPPFSCTGHPVYTTEATCVAGGGTWDPQVYHAEYSGNVFDWNNGTINVSGTNFNLTWIYADWLSALPRAIYKAPAGVAGSACNDPRYTTANCAANGGTLVAKAGAAYSCSRCHTTGWTSDATVNTAKLPETLFSGITWDRSGNAPANVVDLAGGVANDPKKSSSWDQWGITCTRCHSSAVDTLSHGGVAPFTAPAGMSTHHTNLTSADFPGGCSALSSACSGGRCTAANCSAAVGGGTWYYGYCTDSRFIAGGQSAALAKTSCETANGLGPAAPGVPLGTWVTPCSDNTSATQADCTLASGTWTLPTSSCSVVGICNKAACSDGASTTQAACLLAGGTWGQVGSCSDGVSATKTACVAALKVWTGPEAVGCTAVSGQYQLPTDIVSCQDAGGKWTGSLPLRGQIITALCMNCHRQENKGLPYTNGTCSVGYTSPSTAFNKTYAAGDPGYDQGSCVAAGGVWTDSGNGLPLIVGNYHSTITFPSHPHSHQLLNSPHARFTGKFNQVATAKNFAGYSSYFMFDAEAANTGSGCTTCHEVHTSTVSGEKPFREECTGCHAGPYNKDLAKLKHPAGVGTPLEKMATEPSEACVTCHMPNGQHLFRINADVTYSTFDVANAMTKFTPANTAPEGSKTDAVWVDLDAACGQCHGGGKANPRTTGNVSGAALTVVDATGFAVNQRIKVAGAGAYYYDEIGSKSGNNDFESYIKAISGNVITLAGAATMNVTGAAVEQNPTRASVPYYTKVQLAAYASGIHDSAPPTAIFTVTNDPVVTTKISVDATGSTCGTKTPCSYDWNWGDGSVHATTLTATKDYAPLSSPNQDFSVTLTVKDSTGAETGSAVKTVSVYTIPTPPVASISCSFSGWTATCSSNGTTPAAGFKQIVFNWGDGTSVDQINASPWTATKAHTYLLNGVYTITIKVIDGAGQAATATTATNGTGGLTFPTYAASGKVVRADGTTGLAAAQVRILKGTTVIKSTMSAANGTFDLGTLKPGTYTISTTKYGYLFDAPSVDLTTGPQTSIKVTANK